MRTFFKEPTYELLPVDDMNAVPFIYKISDNCPFRVAAEYPKKFVLVISQKH